MINWTGRLVALAFILMFLPGYAHAYSWWECFNKKMRWYDAPVSLRLLPGSFPPGNPYELSIRESAAKWGEVAGSWISFSVGQDSNNSAWPSNGNNEIYWYHLDEDILGLTIDIPICYWWGHWYFEILESDVIFNMDQPWTLNGDNDNYSAYRFEPVALHELGHAIGLGHYSSILAIMNPNYPNGQTLGHHEKWGLHSDEMAGARALYSQAESFRNLGTTRYKRVGSSTIPISGSSWAVAGSTATLDFTFENYGTQSETFNIGFYLSRNRHITKSDILLGTNTGASAGPGGSGTFQRSLTIPASIPSGDYYLGYIVDTASQVPDDEQEVSYIDNPFGDVFVPTNYYRDNFMAKGTKTQIYGISSVPDSYHATAEVTWQNIEIDAFGWTPSEIYLLSSNSLGTTPFPLEGCGPAVDLANPQIQQISPSGQITTVPPPVGSEGCIDVEIDYDPPNVEFYMYPYCSAPRYIQALVKAPNGCFVKSTRRSYKKSFDM